MKYAQITLDPKDLLNIPDDKLGPNAILLKCYYESNPEKRTPLKINLTGPDTSEGILFEEITKAILSSIKTNRKGLVREALLDPIIELKKVIDGMVYAEGLVHVHFSFNITLESTSKELAEEVLRMLRAPTIPDPELF